MKENYSEEYYEKLTSKIWAGIIVDNEDPLQMGRVKIRLFGKTDIRKPNDKGDLPDEPLKAEDYLKEELFSIPTKHLPWFFQAGSQTYGGGESKGYGSFSFPKLGTVVQVVFISNDPYSGQYYSIVQPNDSLLDLIKDTDDLQNYINSHVLTLDEDEKLKVFYTPSQGLELNLKDSRILIRPDNSIFIEHVESSSMIELKGGNITIYADNVIDGTAKNKVEFTSQVVHANGKSTRLGTKPIYSVVRAEPLYLFLKALATAVDAKLYPTPGVMVGTLESAYKQFKSTTVKTS